MGVKWFDGERLGAYFILVGNSSCPKSACPY